VESAPYLADEREFPQLWRVLWMYE
jgi:hypothetical protein